MKNLNLKLWLCAIMLGAVTGANAYDAKIDGIYYNFSGTKATVTYLYQTSANNKDAYSGSVTIPETVTYGSNTYSVTSIGRYAFCGCSGLTSIEIPESVTSIGENAFYNCTGLTSVTIPESVTSIGSQAFYGCTGLTSVVIPNSVTSIGFDVFNGSPWYDNQPDGVVYAGKVAYTYKGTMPKGTEIILQEGTTGIAQAAFLRVYDALTSITIPNSVVYIGRQAFQGCTGLTSIEIPNSVTSIGEYAFNGCSGLTSVEIGNSVTSIGGAAFSGCTGLTSIEIPNSVTSIGGSAFSRCTGITELTIADGEGTLELGYNLYLFGTEGLFYDCPLKKLYLGRNLMYNSVENYGYSPFYGKNELASVNIGNSVTSINSNAFQNCTGLTSIEIPNSVAEIGGSAFSGCSGLTSVTINSNAIASKTYTSSSRLSEIFGSQVTSYAFGESVEKIGGYACYNLPNITNLSLPETLTSIGAYTFYGCSGLTSVEIPNSVTSIGESAFNGCSGLTSVVVENGNTKYDSRNGCNAIIETASNTLIAGCKNTIIPNSVTSIGESAFNGCTGLTSIEIPNSVTSIGGSAFSGCSGLTSVEIPNSVTKIGSGAFNGCSGLTSVNINCSTVEQWFRGNTSIQQLTIGNNVTCIGDEAYMNCSSLASVSMGDNVTAIGRDAFKGTPWYENQSDGIVYVGKVAYGYGGDTSTFKKLELKEGTVGIASGAFSECSNLISTSIPASVKNIGSGAFKDCNKLTRSDFASIESLCGIEFGDKDANPLSFTGRLQVNGKEVTELVIPNSVPSIGNRVFYNCHELTSVTIPESVTSIGDEAFEGCSGLTSVTIPNSVTSIGDYAFNGCSGLTSVEIGNSVTSIGSYAFSGCSGLTSIEIPNSVTTIGDYAFNGCSGLSSVEIGNSVTSIGYRAFSGCSGLTKAEFASIESFCNILFGDTEANPLNYAHHLYVDGNAVENVVLPNGLTAIDNRFQGCVGIKTITIPNSVTTIGENAFSGCRGLTRAEFASIESFCNIQFGNTEANPLFYAHHLFINGNEVENVVLPNGLTAIDNRFQGCVNIKNFTIPNSIVTIGENAFNGCTGMASISIPESVTNIGNNAFCDCGGLKDLVIEDGENTLSLGHQQYSKGLFCDCPLETLYLGRNLSYTLNPFTRSRSIKSITIGNSVTNISDNMFEYSIGLTSITIPNNVTSIGKSAFQGCTGLTDLTIKNRPKAVYDGYDVTNNISSYEESKEQWVWDTSKNAWYVLNNKQEYEAYGVYGTDKETWYEGKLAIVDGHEWEYSGGKWNDLGKTTDTQVVEYIERNSDNTGHIDLGVTFKANTKIQLKYYPTNAGGRAILGDWNTNDNDDWRIFFAGSTLYYDFDSSRQSTSKSINTLYEWEIGNYYIRNIGSTSNILSGTAHTDFSNRTHNILLGTHGGSTNGDEGTDYGRVYYIKIYEGETLVKDFVPHFDGTAYGLWDNVTNKAYMPTDGTWTGEKTGTLEYPKYYAEKEAPYVAPIRMIDESAFEGCSKLSTIAIPNSIASIGKKAFNGCNNLEDLTIGNGVTFIGEGAFGSSDHISHLLVKCATPPSAANAFSDKTYDYTTLYVPIGKVDEYAYDDTWYRFYTVKESTVTTEESEVMYAYTLMDVKTFNYATYDAANDCVKMVTASEVNEKDPNHCWQTVEVNGLKFLYNIGAKKFAVPTSNGSVFRLSENVGSISMEDGDDGIILGGNANWQWALVIDEKMDAYLGLEDVVATGVLPIDNGQLTMDNAKGVYDLSGRRMNVNDNVNDNLNSKCKIQNSKLRKGIYVVNGKKLLKR